VTFAIDFVYLS